MRSNSRKWKFLDIKLNAVAEHNKTFQRLGFETTLWPMEHSCILSAKFYYELARRISHFWLLRMITKVLLSSSRTYFRDCLRFLKTFLRSYSYHLFTYCHYHDLKNNPHSGEHGGDVYFGKLPTPSPIKKKIKGHFGNKGTGGELASFRTAGIKGGKSVMFENQLNKRRL